MHDNVLLVAEITTKCRSKVPGHKEGQGQLLCNGIHSSKVYMLDSMRKSWQSQLRIKCMSQGPEKSQPPEVGIEPGQQDLKANTLPRRCIAGFYSNVVECLPLDSAAQVRFPPRVVGIFLHPVTCRSTMSRCVCVGCYLFFAYLDLCI